MTPPLTLDIPSLNVEQSVQVTLHINPNDGSLTVRHAQDRAIRIESGWGWVKLTPSPVVTTPDIITGEHASCKRQG